MNFQWSLKSPSSGDDVNGINNTLNALSKDADSILIPGTILTAGRTYEFELGVANFLNPSTFEKVTHSVIKAANPVPFLSIFASSDEGEVYVSEELSIKVTADVGLQDSLPFCFSCFVTSHLVEFVRILLLLVLLFALFNIFYLFLLFSFALVFVFFFFCHLRCSLLFSVYLLVLTCPDFAAYFPQPNSVSSLSL